MYFIQHCFICRPLDFTVLEDAGIAPRTVVTLALAVRRSNHSASLDLIHNRLHKIGWAYPEGRSGGGRALSGTRRSRPRSRRSLLPPRTRRRSPRPRRGAQTRKYLPRKGEQESCRWIWSQLFLVQSILDRPGSPVPIFQIGKFGPAFGPDPDPAVPNHRPVRDSTRRKWASNCFWTPINYQLLVKLR
jgi:hypothetical protein